MLPGKRPSLAAFSLVFAIGVARADEVPVVNVRQYRPSTPANRGFQLESVRTLPHLQYASGFDLDYARLPLLLDGGGGRFEGLLQHVTAGDLMMAVGLFDRFEVSAGLPFVAFQGGSLPSDTNAPPPAALGDLRLAVRARIASLPRRREVSFGAGMVLSLPVGSHAGLVNDSGAAVEPRVLAEFRWRQWQAGARLGYRIRGTSDFFGAKVGNQISFALGGQMALERTTQFITELVGMTPGTGDIGTRALSPIELTVGLRQQVGLFAVGLGGGPGLVSGYGSPAYRLLVSLGWGSHRPDADHDGISDEKDICPYDPEDKDGFEDRDGCPDPDNDKDGILDGVDKCPDQAETKNKFQDEDGCPDTPPVVAPPDKDKDGIPDAKDKCPAEPETKNDFQDDDGCPDEKPAVEDKDKDKDGILDDDDECEDEAEDKDGFEDDDGCPDPDNDKDGILDGVDKCPDKPETINGNEDEDGCPDEGKVQVKVGAKQLDVSDPIFFDTDAARVRHRFYSTLKQVAQTLKSRPDVGRCAIEGHTDGQGPAAWNKQLSLKRAEHVVNLLVEYGVDRSRLSVVGHGQAMPWADNATEEGRARNRRVIFHIEGLHNSERNNAEPAKPSRRKAPRFKLLQSSSEATPLPRPSFARMDPTSEAKEADTTAKEPLKAIPATRKPASAAVSTEGKAAAPQVAPAKVPAAKSLRELVKLPPR